MFNPAFPKNHETENVAGRGVKRRVSKEGE
jgi:hypothetical protein